MFDITKEVDPSDAQKWEQFEKLFKMAREKNLKEVLFFVGYDTDTKEVGKVEGMCNARPAMFEAVAQSMLLEIAKNDPKAAFEILTELSRALMGEDMLEIADSIIDSFKAEVATTH